MAGYLATGKPVETPTAEFRGWQVPEDSIQIGDPLPRVQAVAADAAARLDGSPAEGCVVEILGQGTLPEGAGVAVVDRRSGATVSWRRLIDRKLPLKVKFQNVPSDNHWAVLARNANHVRFTYLNRARLKKDAQGGWLARLHGQTFQLTVQVDRPDADVRYVPILIRRPDDHDWRYWSPHLGPDCPYGLVTNEKGQVAFDMLCAGEYEVRTRPLVSQQLPRTWRRIRMDQHRTIRLKGAR